MGAALHEGHVAGQPGHSALAENPLADPGHVEEIDAKVDRYA